MFLKLSNVKNFTKFETGNSDIRNAGDGDIMFDDANINFVRDCGGGGGMYQAGPGVVLPRNKVSSLHCRTICKIIMRVISS